MSVNYVERQADKVYRPYGEKEEGAKLQSFGVSNPTGLLTDNSNQVAGIQDLREREV